MRCLYTIIIIMICASCRQEREPYVISNVEVLDSLNSIHFSSLEYFSERLSYVVEFKEDFDLIGINISDESDLSEIFARISYDEFLNIDEDLTEKNTVFILHRSNISLISSNFNLIEDLSSFSNNYIIMESYSISNYPSSIWEIYSSHNKFKQYNQNDSLTQPEVEGATKRYELFVERLKNVRYFVAIQDIAFLSPIILDKTTFDGGALITNVKVYDIDSKIKIGQKQIFSQNADSVSTFRNLAPAIDTENMIEMMGILNNLTGYRDREILKFLDFNSDL